MAERGKVPPVFQRVSLEEWRRWLLKQSVLCQGRMWRCHYCNGVVTTVDLTVDHMHPASAGGLTDFPNLVPSCVKCNVRKGDMTASDFLRLLGVVREMSARGQASLWRRLTSRVQHGWHKKQRP